MIELAERKSLSKKIRFEVFKRDKFTCQYCGKSAPDVVLEVDHIKPISKGGSNEMINLVTACFDCNRGKTNIELSDDAVVKRQEKQIRDLAERKEQLNMLLQWRAGLAEIDNDCIDAVDDVFRTWTEWGISEHGRKSVKKWINEFGLNEVLDATEKAIEVYYCGTEGSWNIAFSKISGICANRNRQKEFGNIDYYVNYTAKALKERNLYCDKNKVRDFYELYVNDEKDFEKVKDCLKKTRSWTDFRQRLVSVFVGKTENPFDNPFDICAGG